jgi:hypothetical protein
MSFFLSEMFSMVSASRVNGTGTNAKHNKEIQRTTRLL